MDKELSQVEAERALLRESQDSGSGATVATYLRLSGPGWLQSAITLGGGSLAGALFLGVLGGTSLLWLQLVAISMGVVMLSAISYVTLSTGKRPFRAINQHINPVLGWGWLIATSMANMIWCMPQFSLCYASLQKNLVGPAIQDDTNSKLMVSAVILIAAGAAVFLNSRRGLASKVFDWFLKALVGMIVLCFVGVVIYLARDGRLDWSAILAGFVPNLSPWSQPSGELATLVSGLPAATQSFWSELVVKEQRAVMIGAAATAVGINMTFLLPYSMLNRGWDRPFRGLARFDLCTGMAIPYVLVTSCVVIASASSFHATVDTQFISEDPEVMAQSPLFAGAEKALRARISQDVDTNLSDSEELQRIAALSIEEKRIASSLVRRDAFQLSQSLAPLLGEQRANLVFGLGIFGMGFSTIIILMLINGYAVCEMLGKPQGGTPHIIGCLVAGVSGAMWPVLWDGPAKLWLAILTSSFGMMLLPIAYFTFFMMMNNRQLMGDQKPTGARMLIWNVLMGVSVLGAIAAAATAIIDKASNPIAGKVVIGVAVVYVYFVIIGFFFRSKPQAA